MKSLKEKFDIDFGPMEPAKKFNYKFKIFFSPFTNLIINKFIIDDYKKCSICENNIKK